MLLKLVTAATGYSLIALLIRRGLWRRYLPFLLLIGLQSTVWAVDELIPGDYRRPVFLGVTLSGWFLYAFVVCQMFTRLFGTFPGIARTGNRVIAISLLLAIAISFLTTGEEFGGNTLMSIEVTFATVGERVVSAAILLYLILLLLFLRWMPVPVPENTVRHTIIFFFYFAGNALAIHYWNRVARQEDLYIMNTVLAGLTITAFSAWAWLIRPEGEFAAPVRKAPTPDSTRILNQLEAINRALGRSSAGN
jgi:hypothetical protein